MNSKSKVLSLFLILTFVLSFTIAPVFAATDGTAGAKPLDFVGAYLTTITGTTSTTGESIIDSTTVPLRPTIKVLVDKNIVTDTVWPNNQTCFTLQDASGTNVPINVTMIPDTVNFSERNNAFISPLNDLVAGKSYRLIVSGNLTAKTGVKMKYDKVVNFTTLGATDTTAPVWASGSSLTASNVTQTGVTLNWTAATDNKAVTSYKVYNGTTLIGTVTGTSYTVSGLTAGTQYTFKVQAGDAAGNWTTNGPAKTVTTAAASDTTAPVWANGSSLTASNVTQTGVTLNWTAATDNKAVTSYRVYNGTTLIGTVTGTSYTVSGLTAGTQYTFKVQAGDAAGNWTTNGPAKTVTTAAASDTTAPVWASGSSLTASNVTQTGVTLNWTAATDNKAVTSYKVYNGTTLLGTVTGTSYTVSGLTAGTQYTFKVQAGDAAGNWTTNGPAKTVTTAAASDTTAPVWASGSSLTASNVTQTGVTLNWTAATDNKAVTSYKVYNGTTLLGTVTGTSYTVSGLTAGTQYTFKVQAGDAAGNWTTNGPAKTVTTAAASDTTAPVWASGSSLTASNVTQTGVTLNWTAATDNKAVTSYKVYNGTTLLGTVTGTSYTVSGLTAGTQYTFKVQAGDAAGNWTTNGPAKTVTTAAASDTTAPVWASGSSLTASNVTQAGVTLNWTAATDNKAVTSYKVYNGTTLLGTVTGTSYTVSGLTAGTQYTFKVQAGDAAGNWTTNGPAKTITTQQQPPTSGTAPTWRYGSKVSAYYVTKNGLVLKWTPATDKTRVKTYKVYRGTIPLGTVTGTYFVVHGLNPGTQYTFKVEACNAAGYLSTNGPSVNVVTKK
ncbi:Exoglucanase B precursor [Sporomusa ovata DSM 2662]|uniref:fibronectin type III domain-containing protein n=3 Tax=Sporomusa ovata TaxID=2378 RepID=UPI0030D1F058